MLVIFVFKVFKWFCLETTYCYIVLKVKIIKLSPVVLLNINVEVISVWLLFGHCYTSYQDRE